MSAYKNRPIFTYAPTPICDKMSESYTCCMLRFPKLCLSSCWTFLFLISDFVLLSKLCWVASHLWIVISPHVRLIWLQDLCWNTSDVAISCCRKIHGRCSSGKMNNRNLQISLQLERPKHVQCKHWSKSNIYILDVNPWISNYAISKQCNMTAEEHRNMS